MHLSDSLNADFKGALKRQRRAVECMDEFDITEKILEIYEELPKDRKLLSLLFLDLLLQVQEIRETTAPSG